LFDFFAKMCGIVIAINRWSSCEHNSSASMLDRCLLGHSDCRHVSSDTSAVAGNLWRGCYLSIDEQYQHGPWRPLRVSFLLVSVSVA